MNESNQENVQLEGFEAEFIAAVAHEVNAALCAAFGDTSQPSWEEAPEWQKESAINGVLFHQHNPDAGPESSHENWCKEKRAAGWTYGPVKKPDVRKHPCLVPFESLPPDQQAKDYVFRQIVHSLTPPEVFADASAALEPVIADAAGGEGGADLTDNGNESVVDGGSGSAPVDPPDGSDSASVKQTNADTSGDTERKQPEV